MVGAPVGPIVGEPVGVADGATLGVEDGEPDGAPDGAAVGDVVCWYKQVVASKSPQVGTNVSNWTDDSKEAVIGQMDPADSKP